MTTERTTVCRCAKTSLSVSIGLWAFGGFLATLATWLVSLVLCDSVVKRHWLDAVDTYVPVPGSVARMRSEGWGKSHYGLLGVGPMPNAAAIEGDKVLVWGDSYVEALQVDDDEKLAQQLSALISESGMRAIGMGRSGQSVADYYFQIPRYEALMGEAAHHFIVVADVRDLLPDSPDSLRARLVTRPVMRWIPEAKPGNRGKLHETARDVVIALNAHFLMSPLESIALDPDSLLKTGLDLRLHRQREPAGNPETEQNPSDHATALAFVMDALKSVTSAPITFVYIPAVPWIAEGKIEFDDAGRELARMLKQSCQSNGLGFIDLRRDFIRCFLSTSRFPRGFLNSYPGKGHLNTDGHGIVAKAMAGRLLGH